jgi:hypothetical protein
MIGLSTTLKAFNETEKMAIARSLVSLFSAFVIFKTAITPVTITNTGSGIYSYSISPAISNGLSFNKKTGTISGAPIVAADPVLTT